MQIKSISFCIPTFNRCKLLTELLDSFFNADMSENYDYEILIYDDGSTDSTLTIVNKFINNTTKKIRYFKQDNKGRATTLINLLNLAEKEYLMIFDDDDLLPSNFFTQLKDINKNIEKIIIDKSNLTKQIGGISFLSSDVNGKLIGNKFKKNYLISNYFNVFNLDQKKGDVGDIFNVKILKENLYKVQNNEKRASTGLIYLNLSKKYNFIYINSILKIKRYFEDGISNHILYYKTISPNYSLEYEKLLLEFKNLPNLIRIRCYININRFILHGAKKIYFSKSNEFYLKFFYMLSLILFIIDKIKLKRIKNNNINL